jgi:wyosine [tRNA(Phe)-imidazoG37] synthetase (radical SAM superfamily)
MPFFDDREKLVGKYGHAAYKTCYWTEQKLRTGGRRGCYKSPFGIQSHLCMQSTSFRGCNLGCVFCWRNVEERQHSHPLLDEPSTIVEQIISEQIAVVEESLPKSIENYYNMGRILFHLNSGGGCLTISKIAEKTGISKVKVKEALCDLKNAGLVSVQGNNCILRDVTEKFDLGSEEHCLQIVDENVASLHDIIRVHNEALHPKHVAISYDGEPTMYRRIPELIDEFRRRNISTFLVSNGTFPERIKEMKETGCLPTQLYITLAAPNEEIYLKTCSSISPFFPATKEYWERLQLTLQMLHDLPCRTVIRITSVRGVNMTNPAEYRDIVRSSQPSFLELKGFSITGNAPRISRRLGEFHGSEKDPWLMKLAFKFAPTHREIRDFAREISDDFKLFPFVSESAESRQILLAVGWKDLKSIAI